MAVGSRKSSVRHSGIVMVEEQSDALADFRFFYSYEEKSFFVTLSKDFKERFGKSPFV